MSASNRADRNAVRANMEEGEFLEVFVNTFLEVCESRDPKGLYKKARAGEISDFTGISSPYETPENPELMLDANSQSPNVLADQVIQALVDAGKLK